MSKFDGFAVRELPGAQRPVVKYHVVTADRVQDMLEQGWELYGSAVSDVYSSDDGVLTEIKQPMILRGVAADEVAADAALSEKEIATVLAALRSWQAMPESIRESEWLDYFNDVGALTNEEIDELCERLNT